MRTVKEISELTGISVRTLHYYDEIGLLKPTQKSDAGYRLYDDKALETLQQILFFREFDISLKEIKAVLDNPALERNQILQVQRKMLVTKKERMERLIASIDDILKGENKMDFTIFTKTEVEEMFQTMLEHMPENMRNIAIKEFGSIEQWKKHYMEVVSSVQPDWILSPSSLKSDLKPKYEAIDTEWAFLNLKSVQGMYRSIQELGIIFDREKEADSLIKEFVAFYKKYKSENKTKSHPKVLILMGLPGSYIIATPNSYVGNLVELAGAENVYSNTKQEFLTVNTEDMKKKEPDIILRAAHAMPKQVIKMFNDDFKKNDIWKHFNAVKEGRVYDLSYDKFGMSATFKYKEALAELKQDFERR